MPTQMMAISVGSIDDAAGNIISFLRGTKTANVMFFNGWCGLGASAVLNAVVKQLRSSLSDGATRTAMGLDMVIHIDCSLWQSMRILQRVIAEELELPQSVMDTFDQHDKEDDFDGVEKGARGVILDVKLLIFDKLYNCRFLVIFHNGSGNYIDLLDCGIPMIGFMNKRVLWTSQGRFQLRLKEYDNHDERVNMLAGLSDIAIFVERFSYEDDNDVILGCFKCLLHAETEEVARYTGIPKSKLNLEIVIECILYKALKGNKYGIDWGTHTSNYWVCDGILQADTNDGGRSAWEIGDALQRNMNLDWSDDWMMVISDTLLQGEQRNCSNRWVSVTHQNATAVQVPLHATSFFCTAAPILQAGMFGHSDTSMLHVIHLSHCTFSFLSPPFLGCNSLRFLLLDGCKDNETIVEQDHHHSRSRQDCVSCFQKLWVLDVSYTDWYWLLSEEMICAMIELRELNVKGINNWNISHLCCGSGVKRNTRLLKLRVIESIDINQASPAIAFPNISIWSILSTIILDGCAELEHIDPNAMPPMIESLSFFSNGATKIKKISFRGCCRFKTLLTRGLLENLEEMDMSGTIVKILDLSAVQVPGLKRLMLLGCEQLCAILWPQEGQEPELEVLRIDTTHATLSREEMPRKQEATSDATSVRSSSTIVLVGGRALTDMDIYISVRDARLFRSLRNVDINQHLQVEISPANTTTTTSDQKGIGHGGAINDVDVDPTIMSMWPCPPIPSDESWVHCYISVQDEMRTKLPQGISSTEQENTILKAFILLKARTLHLHDSLSVTSILVPRSPAIEFYLQWCRLERCPNLDGTVFTDLSQDWFNFFCGLKTFWASQLLKARYMWDRSASSFRYNFKDLIFLHLDCCPKLVHVLPLYTSKPLGCESLEILEIVCCGDLKEVFPLDSESQQQEPRKFPRLRHIHLHELPMLQRICGRRMSAPDLETVKIRGCWNLKSLPSLSAPRKRWRYMPPLPKVDCEKDWWDNLEWDGKEAYHHPSLYWPCHSKYYKKTMLRGPILR